jgi:hypothetical protein
MRHHHGKPFCFMYKPHRSANITNKANPTPVKGTPADEEIEQNKHLVFRNGYYIGGLTQWIHMLSH